MPMPSRANAYGGCFTSSVALRVPCLSRGRSERDEPGAPPRSFGRFRDGLLGPAERAWGRRGGSKNRTDPCRAVPRESQTWPAGRTTSPVPNVRLGSDFRGGHSRHEMETMIRPRGNPAAFGPPVKASANKACATDRPCSRYRSRPSRRVNARVARAGTPGGRQAGRSVLCAARRQLSTRRRAIESSGC